VHKSNGVVAGGQRASWFDSSNGRVGYSYLGPDFATHHGAAADVPAYMIPVTAPRQVAIR